MLNKDKFEINKTNLELNKLDKAAEEEEEEEEEATAAAAEEKEEEEEQQQQQQKQQQKTTTTRLQPITMAVQIQQAATPLTDAFALVGRFSVDCHLASGNPKTH